MSNSKKSFLLHIDSLEILDELTNDQCGLLFKACRDFNLGVEVNLDSILSLVFFSFKKQFERDGVKYKTIVDRNKSNGNKGGRPKKEINPSKPKKPSGLIDNPSKPKKADSVNVSDNDNGNDSDKEVIKDLVTTKKYNFSEVDYQCADWVYRLIKKVAPSSKNPNLESWANTIRLMRESDKLTHQDIKDVFTWANKDSFWSTNILSITKLRKQFPQLQAKMKGVNNGTKNQGTNAGANKKESSHERIKRENDIKYRGQDKCGLDLGATNGHLGGDLGKGKGIRTIDHVDHSDFVDY